ncbi:hypothetical protein [Saccharothrix deserti]|uniref:hypothetical protein n=1 Tax=Saccharothrix deserti TaxID=2593674 RepID=UPI00192E3706|nr:hypothetical protein [Saccharothrix deserti]
MGEHYREGHNDSATPVLLAYDILRLPREARARTIELLGREVAPRVRELLTEEPTHA